MSTTHEFQVSCDGGKTWETRTTGSHEFCAGYAACYYEYAPRGREARVVPIPKAAES